MPWKKLARWIPRFFVAMIVLLAILGWCVVLGEETAAPIAASQGAAKESKADEGKTGGNKAGYAATATIEEAEVKAALAKSTAEEAEAKAKAAESHLSERADELKNRIDELKWILGLIVTAAGLFTLAQGIAAGFSAQSFTKQGDDIVARLNKLETDLRSRFETMTGEVKAQYPIFSEMETRRSTAFANLSAMLKKYSPLNNADEGFDSRHHFYRQMPLAQRQEILSVERFISYEIAGQNDPPEEFARQLRRLAQFYWAKFLYEHGRGLGYQGDLERAEYLLDVAKRRAGNQFYLLNDQGNIRLESFKARVDPRLTSKDEEARRQAEADRKGELDNADKAFEDSITAQPEQLRAYYNRAVIEAAYWQNFGAAAKLLEDGLQYPNWETTPILGLRCNAYFNLGCCYARLADREQDSTALQAKCVAAIAEAAKIGQIDPKDVKREYGSVTIPSPDSSPLAAVIRTGDLFALATSGNDDTRRELAASRPRLSANFVRN